MIFEIVCILVFIFAIMFLGYTLTSFVVYMVHDWGIFRPDGRIDMLMLAYAFVVMLFDLVVLGMSAVYVLEIIRMI